MKKAKVAAKESNESGELTPLQFEIIRGLINRIKQNPNHSAKSLHKRLQEDFAQATKEDIRSAIAFTAKHMGAEYDPV